MVGGAPGGAAVLLAGAGPAVTVIRGGGPGDARGRVRALRRFRGSGHWPVQSDLGGVRAPVRGHCRRFRHPIRDAPCGGALCRASAGGPAADRARRWWPAGGGGGRDGGRILCLCPDGLFRRLGPGADRRLRHAAGAGAQSHLSAGAAGAGASARPAGGRRLPGGRPLPTGCSSGTAASPSGWRRCWRPLAAERPRRSCGSISTRCISKTSGPSPCRPSTT